jgi:hypothetical protein
MKAKSVAMWVGVLTLVVGVAGFIPPLTPDGKVLGLFLVDPLHNVVHILTGALAIFAARSSEAATRTYFKVFGVVYALVTVHGFATNSGLPGLLPTNEADNVFHLVLAALFLYYGFVEKDKAVKA